VDVMVEDLVQYKLTLRDTTRSICHGEDDNKSTPTTPICHTTDETPEYHAGSESSNKQNGNRMLGVSIGIIKCINVWPLQPIG
jgi:hypothetical protein